ncbi:MAG: glycosyltransferase [Verrucomicrobia bacterium]|jgi:glycosyltransferase involved in cell wall biosynthesis|nr:glycosyltransferase [Verrucomicrobiota bacterium]
MKCLWLTRKYPRPTNSGELIYSNGLIRAFAKTGADLTVLAHDNEEAPIGDGSEASIYRDEDRVEWRLGSPALGSRLGSLFTRYPADSWRLKNGGPERAFAEALDREAWDAILIDHAALGWALGPIRNRRRAGSLTGDPAVVYISHNHEAKVRREVARNSSANLPRRFALRLDAEKYARQEEALCREADLVTAITPAEVEAYREQFPGQQYLCLTPGYEGPFFPERRITAETPRRVVMSGSFEWIAKRINLERFLEQAAAPLSDAGVSLQIVGKTDETFRREMTSRFPSVDFVGRVPEMSPYLLGARMGLIVEEFGGGFKLKTLEYLFHGLPLAGLVQAVEGLPLRSPDQLLLEPDVPSLINAITGVIDDIDRLEAMRRSSYDRCIEAFRWEDRGQRLFAALCERRGIVLAG